MTVMVSTLRRRLSLQMVGTTHPAVPLSFCSAVVTSLKGRGMANMSRRPLKVWLLMRLSGGKMGLLRRRGAFSSSSAYAATIAGRCSSAR